VNVDVQRIITRYQNLLSQVSQYTKDGKHPEIVIVTKNRPASIITELLKYIKSPIFGENRVLEALSKIETCNYPIVDWHFIGHLQRNKVKRTLGKFSLIHSLSDLKLAHEIQKRASHTDLTISCLMQIDISEDGTKYGFPPDKDYLVEVITELSTMSQLQISGLMTIAPFVSPEETRPYFKRMRELFNLLDRQCSNLGNIKMEKLSMGMSNDYIVALEEGSNMIRIGSAIFEDFSHK
jgi:pyridoxal phosphate enzyme (YggS family)